MISLSGVSKSYGNRAAVDGITLDVPRGSICVLIGPSGCGKSTTLRMINALIRPDAGVVAVNGRNVADVDPAVLRRGIGYVIQSGGLFPHWTVADNIATVPRLLGWAEARVRRRVGELIELVGLEAGALAERFPHQLSGGQQQRVGVARALAADPPVLLMDEPFGALDPATRRTLQDELLAIHANTGKTIVLVTHDVEEAIKLGDRIIVMDSGRIVQDAGPKQLVLGPASAFVKGLVGGDESLLRLLGRIRVRAAASDFASGGGGDPIDADASLAAALARLLRERQERLTVTDRGVRVGSVTIDDIAAELRR